MFDNNGHKKARFEKLCGSYKREKSSEKNRWLHSDQQNKANREQLKLL